MITVREASPKDSAQLRELGAAALQILRRTYRPNAARLAQRGGRRRGGTQLVAVEGGRVVGTVTCDDRGGEVHLRNLAVDPGHQRRGVARQLIETAHERALELGRGCLTVETIRETGNVEIFERLGFDVVRERPSQLMEASGGRPVTDVLLRRRPHGEATR